MNELDLLKTHWQKDHDFIKFKREDIISMIHKSSSSIVKWLLIISCLEFLIIGFIGLSSYFDDPSEFTVYEIVFQIFAHIILFIFVSLFYKQYKRIKVSSNTKALSYNILKTRKLVFNYIKANFILLGIQFVIGAFIGSHFEAFKEGYNDGYSEGAGENLNTTVELVQSTSKNLETFHDMALWIVFIIAACIFFLLLYLYYKIVYTGFTERLKKNYDDLIAIDSEEKL
ncbi:hypothetical protein [Sphingobacterium bovistauri]|uniref:Uncharacterized protein n=1 Tax=Sphingobacterium bovistauri TaxID=2781959 RepID=A0ABS7Z1V3_9SPHI|nr:hypothetical protein [Sphingobacterium bovistauri]MCA5004147.1 hypothetical protein [Sphingobacterium bovistauri]